VKLGGANAASPGGPLGTLSVRSYADIIMPIETKYVDGGLGVLLSGHGKVTGKDIISSNNQIFSSKETMIKNRYGLIDFSNITQYEVSTPEVEIIASQDKKASEYIPNAVVAVVAKKDFVFGMSRMWEIIVKNTGLHWEIMVFRDREEAEAWIKERTKEKFGIDDLTFG
jgi:hypothetical protein